MAFCQFERVFARHPQNHIGHTESPYEKEQAQDALLTESVKERVPQRELVHQLDRCQNQDRNLETPLQREEAAQLTVRIDADRVLKPLPRTGTIGGRKRGAGQ